MSDSRVWPHRLKPTRLPHPWDSPGKNTGVGRHFLLHCHARKVKRESEVAQSCPILSDPVDCSLPGSSVHGIFQARVLIKNLLSFVNDGSFHLGSYKEKLCLVYVNSGNWIPSTCWLVHSSLTLINWWNLAKDSLWSLHFPDVFSLESSSCLFVSRNGFHLLYSGKPQGSICIPFLWTMA